MSIISLLLTGIMQTLIMVCASGLLALLFGGPLGVLVYCSAPEGLLAQPIIYRLLSTLINVVRSVPFIILIVAIIPLTRLIAGTSVGTTAAIVPLTIGAIPFTARIVANALSDLHTGLIEAGKSMGASTFQIVTKILLPEALPNLIKGITLMLVNLIGFSAMAGAVGAGGLGELAIDYGYQRFDTTIMLSTVCLLILLVQLVQWAGDRLARQIIHQGN